MQDFALSNKTVSTLLVKLLHILYDADILSEVVLIKWHNMEKEEEYKAIAKQVGLLQIQDLSAFKGLKCVSKQLKCSAT